MNVISILASLNVLSYTLPERLALVAFWQKEIVVWHKVEKGEKSFWCLNALCILLRVNISNNLV